MRSYLRFGNQMPRAPAGAIYVRNFNHSGRNISVQGSSAKEHGGAVLRSSCGVLESPDVSGDGSPHLLRTLFLISVDSSTSA